MGVTVQVIVRGQHACRGHAVQGTVVDDLTQS